MSNYVITNDINGSINIEPGQVDTTSTSLALVGRNVTNHGQYFAQNTFSQLCNFASPVQPTSPLVGQLWFDSTTGLLNYLTGNTVNDIVWQQIASQTWANSTFATISQLNALSAKEASDIANYVTSSSLYDPPNGATPIPVAAGGTGLNTLGNAGQILEVNSSGGIGFITPSASLVTSFNGNLGATTFTVSTLNLSPGAQSLVSNSSSTGVSISPLVAGSDITLALDANSNIIINNTYSYTLPQATTTGLGGVIVGAGLSVSGGTISVAGVATNSFTPAADGAITYRSNADGTIEFWGITNLPAGTNSVEVTLPVAVSYYIGWSCGDTGSSCYSGGIAIVDTQHITVYGQAYWINTLGQIAARSDFGCAWHVIAKAMS